MPHSMPAHTGEGKKSHTWPGDRISLQNEASAASSDTPTVYSSHEAFLDHLDRHPEDHFLAPIHMYEYEDWAEASDDDDDKEDFEWDAGITDFALFDSDRRRAEESNKPLPSKWNDLLDKQTSALQRALDRRRATNSNGERGVEMESARQTLEVDDLPGLTPDDSPSLRDDLDVESWHGQVEARPSVPNYLTISVTPPDGDEEAANEERIEPSSHAAKRKQQRPGLRHSRTMSGQVHAWRRPSMDMYTVGEEPDNERREELGYDRNAEQSEQEEFRGRGRGR